MAKKNWSPGKIKLHIYICVTCNNRLYQLYRDKKNLSTNIQKREFVTPDYGQLDTEDRTDPRKLIDRPSKPGKSRGSDQSRFSTMQREHYMHKCPYTSLTSKLEAMHFRAVSDGGKYHPGSGMLVAGFLNKAWDDLVWTMHPVTYAMVLNPVLKDTPWWGLQGKTPTHLPDVKHRPNQELLREHYDACVSFWALTSTSGGSHETISKQSGELPTPDQQVRSFIDDESQTIE